MLLRPPSILHRQGKAGPGRGGEGRAREGKAGQGRECNGMKASKKKHSSPSLILTISIGHLQKFNNDYSRFKRLIGIMLDTIMYS